MHKDQVELASHYALAIAGWGEDAASQPAEHREEEKLANISSMIKAKNPSTITAVYAGQFELVDPEYDLQAAIINDPAHDGFFLHDDDGKPITQNNDMRLWECVLTWHSPARMRPPQYPLVIIEAGTAVLRPVIPCI